MKSPEQRQPSLSPSFSLSSKETSRVVTSVESPQPHLGWHSRGFVPHWDHPGMIQSLNFRLGDSLPRHVLDKWMSELELNRRDDGNIGQGNRRDAGIPSLGPPASRRLPDHAKREMELRRRIEEYLDAGHGECWLRRPDIAGLVEGALFHFDGERYRLLAWCIMPNHVHALIETREGFSLADVLHSWKSFTSHEANKLLKRAGEFWQREYLDRYVRNAEHFEKVLAYIEANPVKAGLAKLKAEWRWSSARFRNPGTAGVPPVVS